MRKNEDFEQRRREHIRGVRRGWGFDGEWDPMDCAHNRCTECVGTGVKKNGRPCIHMISCTCSRCRKFSFSVNSRPSRVNVHYTGSHILPMTVSYRRPGVVPFV